MDQENKVFIFDMDGVMVDTIKSLYSIYLEFLDEFNIKGTEEEFKILNGPKIEEIINYLKVKHNLKPCKEELLNHYNEKINLVYSKADLIEGVREILDLLKENRFKIVLASSSKMENIKFVLRKFNLENYFKFIASGDKVTEAKPSPAIYNLVKNYFKDHEFYVVEDSQNGLKSAFSAGMNTIFFNPKKEEPEVKIDYNISKMEEIKEIMEEIKNNCKIIYIPNKIEFKFKEHKLSINQKQEKEVNIIWENEKEKKPFLFNGKFISYISHYSKKDNLIIEYFLTEYKFFLAQLNKPSLNLNIIPLAVSGIILDENNNTLIAKRRNVTQYKDFYEFVPSGGINASNIKKGKVLFIEQLKDEFKEETKRNVSDIKKIEPFCLVLDKKDNVYDICCKIFLRNSIDLKNLSDEYTDPKIININALEEFIKENKFMPTSKMILCVMKEEP